MIHEIRNPDIRVRFAPSPTGNLHIGSLRSAFFNWLFARHTGGTFLLRIEDTDLERSKPEYVASILDVFKWCEIESDEPIVIQSENLLRHKDVAQKMLENGTAYRCFCTPEELRARLGQNAAQDDGYVKYDGKCRELTVDLQKPFAIRFKIPKNKSEIVFNDLIRGEIVFPIDQFDDFIIVRSDGSPMYNFVVVVDDADMRISHVIRGEDHISNTPKQILIYEACRFKIPQFAHIPLILGSDGNRLSKRHAATSVLEYKKGGYLPDALCNYLVRLGWSYGDQEIFSRIEMIQYFSLENVGKKGSIFDLKKLEWMNTIYIRQKSAQQLYEIIIKDLDPDFSLHFPQWHHEQLLGFIELYKERIKSLKELTDRLTDLYHEPKTYSMECVPEDKQLVLDTLTNLPEKLKALHDFSRQNIEILIKEVASSHNLKLSFILQTVRCALTGVTTSPSVYDLIVLLGKEETSRRLKIFEEYFTPS